MNLKKNIIILLILVVLFSVSTSWKCIINYNNYECINYKTDYSYKDRLYKLNKIIIVGDSRMELINLDRQALKIPENITFDAKSGARFWWYNVVAIPELFKLIEKDDLYNYIVVFNMGVNDLNSYIDVNVTAKKYFDSYSKIIRQNNNISFYFLSINPIDETIVNNYFYPQSRTNLKIETYNNYFINRLKEEEEINNVTYCDSYNNLKFVSYDGLHYDFATNKKIMDFIINDCVNLDFYNDFLLRNFY